MKKIRNESRQGLEIYLNTPAGPQIYWLQPREVIIIPSFYITSQIEVLSARQMVKVYE
jgi:hypothetical protein